MKKNIHEYCYTDYKVTSVEYTGMDDCMWAGKPPQFVTGHSGQLSLLPSVGRKMSTGQCSDALWLGSKGRYGSFHLWINMWVADKTV